MPERVESSLLVLEHFRDSSGTTWMPRDRAPLARHAVRRAATERPELFAVEFSTEPFDPAADWFQAVDQRYEAQFAEIKLRREGAEERRQQALRAELTEQERGQPELERRYRKQEAERKQREQKARESRERQAIEHQFQFRGGSGFHF